MHFQKQDMEGSHYTWTASELFQGQPSRRLFDRFNGEQVLFLINAYGSLSGQFTLSEGKRIEQEIANRLPIDIKSEISVFNWMRSAPVAG